MAAPTLPKSAFPRFLVFPTRCRVYAWRVAARILPDAPNHTISRHRNLALAVRTADQLNQMYARLEDAR